MGELKANPTYEKMILESKIADITVSQTIHYTKEHRLNKRSFKVNSVSEDAIMDKTLILLPKIFLIRQI